MNKEDKYSLGYAIGNSIQENKDRIAKLEKQNKKLKAKLEEKDKVIAEALEYINQQIFDMNMVGNGTLSLDRLLEILERGKNGK